MSIDKRPKDEKPKEIQPWHLLAMGALAFGSGGALAEKSREALVTQIIQEEAREADREARRHPEGTVVTATVVERGYTYSSWYDYDPNDPDRKQGDKETIGSIVLTLSIDGQPQQVEIPYTQEADAYYQEGTKAAVLYTMESGREGPVMHILEIGPEGSIK